MPAGHTFTREDFPNFTDEQIAEVDLLHWDADQYASYQEWAAEDVDELHRLAAKYETTHPDTSAMATTPEELAIQVGYGLIKMELALREETRPDGSPRFTMPEMFLILQNAASG